MDAQTSRDAQYELLSKGLNVYFDSNFAATGSNKPFVNKLLDTQNYVIDRAFEDPGTNFQAIGLRSKDGSKPPVLWFPGGDAGDPGSPGFSQFSANKQVIKDWLVSATNSQQDNPQGFKPDIIGQSLGGASTQLTASEFPTLIGSAVSFQSPGIDRQDADKFIENGGDPNQIRHYIVDGDFRSLGGEAFLPGKVVVSNYEIPTNEPGDYASRKHLSGILADFSSVMLDNIDLSPSQAESFSLSGKPADQTLSEISVDELNQPDFTFQGKDWQELLAKAEVNNPNTLIVTDRQGWEESRYGDRNGNLYNLLFQAFEGKNPVPPEQVNQPTAGDDILIGNEDNNDIFGLAGNDYIRSGAGDDQISGNEGKDSLLSNDGNDILCGGSDEDTLTSGKGNDLFLFGDATPFQTGMLGVDRVNDFKPGEDLIGLSKSTFTELGTNFANDFGTVTDDATAANSAEKIVYNTSNGSLFYNPNGTADGFDEGGQFASIFDQPELSADNF
ncbi:MAG: hypothetical protein RLZZ04_4367, partial [Cyanobacteriota bacterium]